MRITSNYLMLVLDLPIELSSLIRKCMWILILLVLDISATNLLQCSLSMVSPVTDPGQDFGCGFYQSSGFFGLC